MSFKTEIKGDTLVLTIDVSEASRKAAVPSSTGKTLLVASSRGKVRCGDVDLMFNALIPAPKPAA